MITDDALADMQGFGAPMEAFAQLAARGEKVAEDYLVYPENWDAVTVFNRMQSQWRYAPSGVRTGLDYPAIETVMRIIGIKDAADTFDRMQTMEMAILANRE